VTADAPAPPALGVNVNVAFTALFFATRSSAAMLNVTFNTQPAGDDEFKLVVAAVDVVGTIVVSGAAEDCPLVIAAVDVMGAIVVAGASEDCPARRRGC